MRDSRTRRQFLVGTTAAATIGIAGCTDSSSQGQNSPTGNHGNASGTGGDGHSDAHGASLNDPSASATVKMTTNDNSFHFKPHVAWVERGGTVTWKLDSGTHTSTAYAGENDKPQRIPDEATAWDSGTISEQGKTFKHTFETPGVYDYFCVPHESQGMIGSVIVGDPDPEGQPGLQPPQDSLSSQAASKIESLNERVNQALSGANSGGADTGNTDGGGSSDDHH